jgi:hypothetical protein
MSVGLYSHTTRGIGTVLTASIYNSDHINHITNQNPAMTGALADSVGQYQTKTDPGGVGTEVLASNLAGELERLRFCIARITGKTQWYEAPQSSLQQALGGSVAGTIALAGATPLTLRRTENDAVDRTVLSLEEGSGAGAKAEWKVKGGAANDVTEVSLFLNSIERVRFASNIGDRYQPQGYLTPTANFPIILADAIAATSVRYETFIGSLVPIIQNGVVTMRVFSPFVLTLNNPNHAAATLYDVFLWDIAGIINIGTGPAWSNSGAGTSARGVGAGTTELVSSSGMLLNNVSMTTRNGASTFAVGAQLATYIGTIRIDAVGTVTCHRSYGQTRRWDVYNAYNRQPIYLKAGDPTANWTYTTVARASNGNSANKLTILDGLAQSPWDVKFNQTIDLSVQANPGQARAVNGIGINSTTVMSGKRGQFGLANFTVSALVPVGDLKAELFQAPLLGINDIQAIESVINLGGVAAGAWQGTEPSMLLSAQWMG